MKNKFFLVKTHSPVDFVHPEWISSHDDATLMGGWGSNTDLDLLKSNVKKTKTDFEFLATGVIDRKTTLNVTFLNKVIGSKEEILQQIKEFIHSYIERKVGHSSGVRLPLCIMEVSDVA